MKCLIALLLVAISGMVAGTFSSCNDFRNDYSEYHNLPDYGWRYSDTLRFVPVHADSLCGGHFVIALRHDESYPYSELWLEVLTEDARRHHGQRQILHDTLKIEMTDKYGHWTGQGIGPSFQITDTLVFMVHCTGSPVKVKHIMRTDTLPGIIQAGLFFVPAKI